MYIYIFIYLYVSKYGTHPIFFTTSRGKSVVLRVELSNITIEKTKDKEGIPTDQTV